MKLFWLKTPFTWIGSLAEFDDFGRAKIVKRVKPEVRRLCSHLLRSGGERVVVPFEDVEFCEILVDIGKVISYKKLQTKHGEERECHRNSASLWLSNKTKYNIATGFGLSDDGIWRRHSWIITFGGNLIETTIAREVYFGMVLNDEAAKMFTEVYI
jgi:hypothetical protein